MNSLKLSQEIRDMISSKERVYTGEIEAGRVSAGTSSISNIYNRYPLKFLTPKILPTVAWVYMVNFGGGLVAGDEISTRLRCTKHATMAVTSQASTKVYKSPEGKMTSQNFDVTVEDGGLFVMVPLPITCFANAKFQQKHNVSVESGGSVVYVDWLTCGRCARGECWAFEEYTSKIHIKLGGKLVVNDCTRLTNDDEHNVAFDMMGYHTVANIFLVGGRVSHISNLVLNKIRSKPVSDLTANKSLMCSATPFLEGDGTMLRVAAASTSIAFNFLRDIFKELFEELGTDPYKN